MAARSKAEVARAFGVNTPSQLFNLSDTGNAEEITQAMTAPGVIFYRPLDQIPSQRVWSRHLPKLTALAPKAGSPKTPSKFTAQRNVIERSRHAVADLAETWPAKS
jgi:hypothetical protein